MHREELETILTESGWIKQVDLYRYFNKDVIMFGKSRKARIKVDPDMVKFEFNSHGYWAKIISEKYSNCTMIDGHLCIGHVFVEFVPSIQ